MNITSMKSSAKVVRNYLAGKSIDICHGDSLEIVARAHGFKDWNVASAEPTKNDTWGEHYQKYGIEFNNAVKFIHGLVLTPTDDLPASINVWMPFFCNKVAQLVSMCDEMLDSVSENDKKIMVEKIILANIHHAFECYTPNTPNLPTDWLNCESGEHIDDKYEDPELEDETVDELKFRYGFTHLSNKVQELIIDICDQADALHTILCFKESDAFGWHRVFIMLCHAFVAPLIPNEIIVQQINAKQIAKAIANGDLEDLIERDIVRLP